MTDELSIKDVDALAQEIRRVDGAHSLGAGALAEALAPYLRAYAREAIRLSHTWPTLRDDDAMTHPHLEGLIRLRERIRMASVMACGGIPNAEAEGWSDELREIIQALAALPGGGVDDPVARTAEHIERAVDYIEKVYPDARTLDRGPILRNMRRWAKNLRASLPTPNPHEADQ